MGGTKLGLSSCEARGSLRVRGMEMAGAGFRVTLGDRKEGGIFYIIQDFSGTETTAVLPGSKDQLWASEEKSFCS